MFRPGYPDALFEWLAGRRRDTISPGTARPGTVRRPAASRGTTRAWWRPTRAPASSSTPSHTRSIEYRAAAAERSGLPDALRRCGHGRAGTALAAAPAVLRRGAARAGARRARCGLGLQPASVASPPLDRELRRFHDEIVGPYWPPERKMVDDHYRGVPFPFAEIAVPPFALEQPMTRHGFEGYLRTWSATHRYRAARADDPLDQISPALTARVARSRRGASRPLAPVRPRRPDDG